ncbi:MAG: flagellar biosynthesis protein FlhA [Gammaproteobacteria bacterium]|jgi:flagellar biosynthesis protein FlhA
MNGSLTRTLLQVARNDLGAPILVILIIGMLVIPLPSMALDLLFTFNISLSLIVLLVVVYTLRPLNFSSFPTVLLIATMLRLALNVASTRVMLAEGHRGTDAAGKVIEAFGDFVVGGNYAVGLVVFAILVIINFVVVTKGAGRVSEVTARFTLDSMPGKQMAIDADLNAGMLDQEEARARREEVVQEADFYGSMDGASKFVRGDAIAGILILFVNILGGLAVGVGQHDMAFGAAMRNYALLTIGDGLVAQIPSLVLSVATAIIVTRVSSAVDIGDQVTQQMFGDPRALYVAASVVAVMGLIPGMPNLVFLSVAGGCAAVGWFTSQRRAQAAAAQSEVPTDIAPPPTADQELSWDDVKQIDPIGLEIGYRLIPLVDSARDGELMGRIKGVRRKLSQELGFLVPSVHIRDNLELPQSGYRIQVLGVSEGEAEIHPDRELAINPGSADPSLQGVATKDPAFGMDAVWITASQRDHAQSLGYTVVDASTVIATHLSKVLQENAPQLLGYAETQKLLDRLALSAPKLVEDLTPKAMTVGAICKVLQNLLREHVPVRDIRSIVETLAAKSAESQEIDSLTGHVRIALCKSIVQEVFGFAAELPVITLDPKLEQLLLQSMQDNSSDGFSMEPGLAQRMHTSLAQVAERQQRDGHPAVLLTAPSLRPWLAKLFAASIESLHVLAYTEIPDNRQVRVVGSVGGDNAADSISQAA